MADLSDVEDAFVGLLSGAFYPNGLTNASEVAADCRIYRGWPLSSGLNNDLNAGVVNISIAPAARPGVLLDALPIIYSRASSVTAFIASVLGTTATFSGTPSSSHCAGLIVDNSTYVYRPRPGDSSGAVAAELAALVAADRIVNLSGSTVSVPGARRLVARVVTDQISAREVRRQRRDIVVACWCPTPSLRDDVARVTDGALARVTFMPLADGTSGKVAYVDTSTYDQAQNALLYRRDLVYSVEYPTVTVHNDPAMLFGSLELGALQLLS